MKHHQTHTYRQAPHTLACRTHRHRPPATPHLSTSHQHPRPPQRAEQQTPTICERSQPYYAPHPRHAPATLEQVRNVLAHHQPAPTPQQDKTATLRAALDTLTNTPLESITAAIQLTDDDRAALAALAAARLDTCPVCADLVPEDSPGPFCSIFCQQRGDTRA